MKIVTIIARILLGLNGFLSFLPAPQLSGVAGAFLGAMFSSHYLYLICAVQIITGVLLLVNQFVPLALALLAPIIANIVNYHVTMQPSNAQLAVLATILWLFLVWRFWAYFTPLFVRKTSSA